MYAYIHNYNHDYNSKINVSANTDQMKHMTDNINKS